MRTKTAATVVLALTLGFGACGGNDADESTSGSGPATSSAAAGAEPTTPDGPTLEVGIRDFAFAPDTVEIDAGTTVVWTNEDEFLHTVTSGKTDGPVNVPDGTFDEPTAEKGSKASITFDEPGSFTYYCKQHNAMNGTVTVR